MTIRRANPRKQGEIGLGAAIAWFTATGYLVSIPLCDNQPYDLVVDDGRRLLRVQVKTTTARAPSGSYVVDLRTNGGNRSRTTSKPFDNAASDLLFILTDGGDRYLIPTADVTCRGRLTLFERYERYRVDCCSSPQGSVVVGGGFEPP